MNVYLEDIISKLGEPVWWDRDGTLPRYCEFHPEQMSDIYAKECVLLLIRCQSCGKLFKVSQTGSIFDSEKLARSISMKSVLFVGDPPNMRCCGAGPTMTSDTMRILEYWHRGRGLDWTRDKEFEIVYEEDGEDLECDDLIDIGNG